MEERETGRLIPAITEMFRFQAWAAMGKVVNPLSGKIDRDLVAAREFIDLLAELETRTEGNRSAGETKLLQGVLTELRINYLDEMRKPAEEEGSAGEAPAKEAVPGGAGESDPGKESE